MVYTTIYESCEVWARVEKKDRYAIAYEAIMAPASGVLATQGLTFSETELVGPTSVMVPDGAHQVRGTGRLTGSMIQGSYRMTFFDSANVVVGRQASAGLAVVVPGGSYRVLAERFPDTGESFGLVFDVR